MGIGLVRELIVCYTNYMYTFTDRIKKEFEKLGVKENIPLSELTSFRIGGNAEFVLDADTYEKIKQAVTLCIREGIPYFLLGKGTNILAPDAGYKGLVIVLSHPIHMPVWSENKVVACAGTSLTSLAKESVAKGFKGMEGLCGIPGSVGGACAMNAGAYNMEMKQILKRVRVLRNGIDQWFNVMPESLGYRRSEFSFPECIVLEAEIELTEDDGFAKERMLEFSKKRSEKQPLEYPSAGSAFKRPTGFFAGALIEQCGLKGKSIGGAQVSPKHAGFIVNTGGATESDVSDLIELVRNTVFEQTGVMLEPEIKRMGEKGCIF